ncbi:MAG: hypothetical protein E4H07_09770 [Nitrosomonadales bacterium]|nr:MAG: hypothetical protein E4H07_09770 [Nitrosomonadales bacterium]
MTVNLQHAIDQLRAHARRDLQRFYAPNHYFGRDHSPIADYKLTVPLLQSSATNQLTVREIAAASALKDLAIYESCYRKIWKDAKLVRDTTERDSGELSESDNREIYARLEMFSCSALCYAKVIGEPNLIKVFDQALPTVKITPKNENTLNGNDVETKLVQNDAKEYKHTRNPWLVRDPNDPEPEQPWYIPARYFARRLIMKDATLLNKHNLLAKKVLYSLKNMGINNRGGKMISDLTTIKKALTNVNLG